jgi:hypothetical protein
MVPSRTYHTIILGDFCFNNGSKLDKIINTDNNNAHRLVAAPKRSQSQDDERKKNLQDF